MSHTYWHKQSSSKPLYPDLIWDRPENKAHAGKMLIIGGNAYSFSAAGSAYQNAVREEIGLAKVLIPDSLKKTVGQILENGEFAPSNKSGGFNKQSLSTWLDLAEWSDGAYIPGDLGRNSETMIVLENFIQIYNGIITITNDALDHLVLNPDVWLDRDSTIAVTSFGQLQKLAINSKFQKAFTYDMPINNLVENLHLFTTIHSVLIVLKHNKKIYVAKDGEVSTTESNRDNPVWRVETAAKVTVWGIQNPSKLFAAVTTAVYEMAKN